MSLLSYMKLSVSFKIKSQLCKDTMCCVFSILISSKPLMEEQNRMQLCNGAAQHLKYKNIENLKHYSVGSPLSSLVTAKSTGTTTGHRWRTTDVTHTRCPGIKLDFLFLGTQKPQCLYNAIGWWRCVCGIDWWVCSNPTKHYGIFYMVI